MQGLESVSSSGALLTMHTADDGPSDSEKIIKKVLGAKLFDDEDGNMWKYSVKDIQGEVLCGGWVPAVGERGEGLTDWQSRNSLCWLLSRALSLVSSPAFPLHGMTDHPDFHESMASLPCYKTWDPSETSFSRLHLVRSCTRLSSRRYAKRMTQQR